MHIACLSCSHHPLFHNIISIIGVNFCSDSEALTSTTFRCHGASIAIILWVPTMRLSISRVFVITTLTHTYICKIYVNFSMRRGFDPIDSLLWVYQIGYSDDTHVCVTSLWCSTIVYYLLEYGNDAPLFISSIREIVHITSQYLPEIFKYYFIRCVTLMFDSRINSMLCHLCGTWS